MLFALGRDGKPIIQPDWKVYKSPPPKYDIYKDPTTINNEGLAKKLKLGRKSLSAHSKSARRKDVLSKLQARSSSKLKGCKGKREKKTERLKIEKMEQYCTVTMIQRGKKVTYIRKKRQY